VNPSLEKDQIHVVLTVLLMAAVMESSRFNSSSTTYNPLLKVWDTLLFGSILMTLVVSIENSENFMDLKGVNE
jgi:hypothetical protein